MAGVFDQHRTGPACHVGQVAEIANAPGKVHRYDGPHGPTCKSRRSLVQGLSQGLRGQ